MKNGKAPTREQKKIMKAQGLVQLLDQSDLLFPYHTYEQ